MQFARSFGKKNKSVKYTEQSFARLEQTDGEGNNALHLACEVNDWEKMMTILAESYKQPAKLKALLLQKNADGQTPIDLAIDAAGDSDTGESHLKLLLSAYVRKLDMLPEMFAEPKDGSEESGIWKRPGFSLPALGGLLTANDQGVLMSKGDKGEELLDANDYPEFLNEYAELPHEAIGLVVAVAFLKEWNEKITWMGKRGRGKWIEGTKPWKAIGGMYTKPSKLGAVFYKLVELAKDAQEAAEAAEDDYRTTEAIKFRELSDRLQSAIATCFDYMGNNVAFAVCCSNEGDAALSLACQSDLDVLLSSSSMRGAILRKWRGKRLQARARASARPHLGAIRRISLSLSRPARRPACRCCSTARTKTVALHRMILKRLYKLMRASESTGWQMTRKNCNACSTHHWRNGASSCIPLSASLSNGIGMARSVFLAVRARGKRWRQCTEHVGLPKIV